MHPDSVYAVRPEMREDGKKMIVGFLDLSYEGTTIDVSVMDKAMQRWTKLGAPADFQRRYLSRRDPFYLIGKGYKSQVIEGKIEVSILLGGTPGAAMAWEQAQHRLGWLGYGGVITKRAPRFFV